MQCYVFKRSLVEKRRCKKTSSARKYLGRSTESRGEELNKVSRLACYRSRDGKANKTADHVRGISSLKF